jgi:hypothetical protein
VPVCLRRSLRPSDTMLATPMPSAAPAVRPNPIAVGRAHSGPSQRHRSCTLPDTALDHAGFELGWDHARFGVRPREDQLARIPELQAGLRAGRLHFGHVQAETDPFIRRWLLVRGNALARSRICDASVTPDLLRQLAVPYCPITRQELTYASCGLQENGAAIRSVDRITNSLGYITGNLAIMSVAANKAKGRRSYDETMDLVRGLRAAAGTVQAVDGLTAEQWERLACLMGYSQPSSRWAETAAQPMVVFPAKYMMTGHALIYLRWLLSHVPWRSGRHGTAQSVCHAWSLNFPGKPLRRAAEKVAFQYCQAAVALYCKLRSAGVAENAAAPWQWLAEDAWRNPAVVTGWKRLVDSISAEDLAHISTPYQISEAESRQWRMDAGSSTSGYLTPI